MLAAGVVQREVRGAGVLGLGRLGAAQGCLSPAVGYHVCAGFAGRQLGGPRVVTASGRRFRHEATVDAGRRQVEFEMREILLLGAAEWVRATAEAGRDRLEQIARE